MPYLRLGMPSLFLCQLHCLFVAADKPYFNFIARPHRDFLNDSRSQRIVIFLDLHIFGRQQHFRLTDFFLSGGAVLNGVKFYDAPTCHHRPQVTSGILAAECARMLKDFFAAKRQKKA